MDCESFLNPSEDFSCSFGTVPVQVLLPEAPNSAGDSFFAPSLRQSELFPSPPRALLYSLSTLNRLSFQYDHSSILAASKATFLARSMHEQELNIKMGVEESDPYQHDNAFQPFSSEALRALLALQEEFSLDSTSVRWIHNLIAVLDPPLRLRFLKRKEEEEGGQAWPPPLPDRTRQFFVFSLSLPLLPL